jgi:tRNA threonylcarbamoyl adenosine modification protein YjeE
MTVFQVRTPDETAALASQLAPSLSAIDFVSLGGDLGTGKTVFARALIRALGVADEITSPTYGLIHEYRAAKGTLHHCDFYRLEGEDANLIGLEDAIECGIVIVEWLDRVSVARPADRLEVMIEGEGEARTIRFTAFGAWTEKLARFIRMRAFLDSAGWSDAVCTHMRGDASTKTFSRLRRPNGETCVLMDWPERPDGPPVRDGKAYCELVHLARNGRPFAVISEILRETAGLATPRILEADLGLGFLLVEDFGDEVYQKLAGEGADPESLFRLAVDGLVALRAAPRVRESTWRGLSHRLQAYSADVLMEEAELLLNWYFRYAAGFEAPAQALTRFREIWRPHLEWLEALPGPQIVLRDYHSPNLILRPAGEGLQRLGVIDFQDALWGHPAYDLVSLLQDARVDLPDGLEQELFASYAAQTGVTGYELAQFSRAYALFGAQRNSKILGVFARLHVRDGKSFYLPHLPRIRRYLKENLEHPALEALRDWYAQHIFVWETALFSDRLPSENANLPL